MIDAKESIYEQSALDLLLCPDAGDQLGSVGSGSTTTDIVIDILQQAEQSRVVGQLVYLSVPEGQNSLVVVGQVSQVTTENEWHEDPVFRGVIKRQGSIPHLSADADVRLARLTVQACFELRRVGSSDAIVESSLGNSPATGTPVYRMTDSVIRALLSSFGDELILLGHVYGTRVLLPLLLKHFGTSALGAGEAYHIGVFGRTGAGKSGLAAYLMVGYARHPDLGMLILDPQGQFSQNRELPFDVHGALKRLGRQVRTFHLGTEVRLPSDVALFCSMLDKLRFYRWIGVAASVNRDYAAEEVGRIVERVLAERRLPLEKAPGDLLSAVLKSLADDEAARKRIYAGREGQERLQLTLAGLLADEPELAKIRDQRWQPALDLFLQCDSRGRIRDGLQEIIQRVTTTPEQGARPVVFLDLSVRETAFRDDEAVTATFLSQVGGVLTKEGERSFRSNGKLNCLVVLDEAHRYASARRDDATEEIQELTESFVDSVRTTRKYGLGFFFVTQSLASLHPAILPQLRICAFGFGLTSGAEASRLEELVDDRQALRLYRSFVDPAARRNREYPFMLTGPASPLSFTGAPLFVQVFTSFAEFEQANAWTRPNSPTLNGLSRPRPSRPREAEL